MLLKKAKQSWKDNFDKILASSEKKEIARLKKYYQNQYRIAIHDYLKTKKINGFNQLFKVTEIADQYSQIYVNIGLRFAKWYSKNFDKVISKQNDVSGYDSIWAERFNTVSQQIAAERVTLVSGTAKQTLIKVFKQLSSDPAFMSMNEREAGRILRQKFAQYSDYQAERLVRTEATNAANVATLQGATDMFGQENLQKEWMTALDGRERPAHRAADGQIVDFKEKFLVGGQLLFNPGDPAGSAKNVINCRCSTAPFPKEEAQAIAEIEGIGVRDLDSASARTVLRTPKPVRETVEQVTDEFVDVKNIKEGKKIVKEMFNKSGIDIGTITVSRNLDLQRFNQYLRQINKLTKKYKINSEANINNVVKLQFKSTSRTYGVVYREYGGFRNWKLNRINFGDTTDTIETRSRNTSLDKFKKTFKSPVDSQNSKIATVTHEFAHIIASRHNAIDIDFYKELKIIEKKYFSEIEKYIDTKNIKAFNETYMGSYANKNIDEFLAECFTEYELREKPSKYAKLVGELVNKYFKK